MSSHGDAGHAHAHFDPEPATTLAPDEPRTPGWVPVVGGIGFLLFGVYFLARHGGEIAKTPASASATATTMAAPPTKPAARAAATQGDRPQRQKPALDASARAALNEQIKKRREAAAQGSAAPKAATGAPRPRARPRSRSAPGPRSAEDAHSGFDPRSVLVLGTGTMGQGIAQIVAAAGMQARLFDGREEDEARSPRSRRRPRASSRRASSAPRSATSSSRASSP